MHIYIRKQSKNIVYIELFFVCIMLWLETVLNLPTAISYITDLFLVYAILKSIGKYKNRLRLASAQTIFIVVTLMFLMTIISLIYNGSSVFMYLWGLRTNGRFYIFFFICIVLLEEIDLNKIFLLFRILFFINLTIVLIQYLGQDIQGDQAGGIFGNAEGCNAYVNIFICLMCAYSIVKYLNKQMKISILLYYIASSFVISIIAELKIFYVEFLVMLIVVVALNKTSILKKIGFLFGAISCLLLGVFLLKKYNLDSFNTIFDSGTRNSYLLEGGYSSENDLNRFTAIFILTEMFFKNNVWQLLLGYGLGSCGASQFELLQSAFYDKYEYLHYNWFSHSWIYLEQGLIGLILCLMFFVSLGIWIIKNYKFIKHNDLCMITSMLLPVYVIGLVYNSALQLYTCYIMAFVCALPFVVMKTKNMKQEEIIKEMNKMS